MNKECNKCKLKLPNSNFYADSSRPDGLMNKCKNCDNQRNTKRINKIRLFIVEYLLEHPCEHCGEADIVVLEFDHKDPSEKSFSIGDWKNSNRLEEVKAEIAKCRVLCANCHRRVTAKAQNSYRTWGW